MKARECSLAYHGCFARAQNIDERVEPYISNMVTILLDRNGDSMKEYYEKLYHDKRDYHWDYIKSGDAFYNQHTKIILNLVDEFGRGKTIDVGCGDGYITSQIAKKFKEVVGVDISKEAIKIAKKKNLKISFVAATCVNLPFSDNSFDTVVASEIIEHVNYNDGKMLLKEAKRILKPQGKLIISTPNLSNPYVKFLQIKRKMRARKNIEHLKEYTKKEFAGSISAYFRIIHLNSDVYLPIIPKINRFIKIPTCCNYCVAEKI